MKFSNFGFFILLFAFAGNICLTAQTGKMDNTNKTARTFKYHYIISAEQGGKSLGNIEIGLWEDVAPLHVAHFDSLVKAGFYDGTAFHRVIPGFMIQGGGPNSKTNPDRNSWGISTPDQTGVKAEFSKNTHSRGIISAARRGNDINSATSQFFICVADSPFLDGQYTTYGEVISGMDVADKIVNAPRDAHDCPNDKIVMKIVRK